jgi:hypothetical protein
VPKRSALTQIQRRVKEVCHWPGEDPLLRMPQAFYHKILVPLTPDQAKMDKTLREEFSLIVKGKPQDLTYAVEVFSKRIQLTGGSVKTKEGHLFVYSGKLALLKDTLISAFQRGMKVVVWHTFIGETAVLQTFLGKEFPHFLDATADPINAFHQFEHMDGGILLTRFSNAEGLNVMADAELSIFYSNPFSYAKRLQAEGRTRRLSSKSTDTYYVDIVTEGGADELVYSQLGQKHDFALTLSNLRRIVESDTL